MSPWNPQNRSSAAEAAALGLGAVIATAELPESSTPGLLLPGTEKAILGLFMQEELSAAGPEPGSAGRKLSATPALFPG